MLKIKTLSKVIIVARKLHPQSELAVVISEVRN